MHVAASGRFICVYPAATSKTQGAPVERIQDLIDNVERVLVGKRESVTLTVVGLLAEGHVLLEDAPGTGKTTLARALAQSIDASFRRIQMTSDLLPSDVLGVSLPDATQGAFRFQPGPIFGNVIVADELNRTTPRTQSSLLECMNERQVSIDGHTRPLPRPFFVIATQNPQEYEGTYPLPESQLDRFLLRIRLGYPDRESERRILRINAAGVPIESLKAVLTLDEVNDAIGGVRNVYVDEAIVDYILDVLEATRRSPDLVVGASPRAGVGLYRAAQALALIEGRDYAVPDDVKRLLFPVLGHRVVAREGEGDVDRATREALRRVGESVSAPH